MANHEPTSCRLCELVPAEGYRRHWKHEAKKGYWHVIADGPDLMVRVPSQAYFMTVLSGCSPRASPLPWTAGFTAEARAGCGGSPIGGALTPGGIRCRWPCGRFSIRRMPTWKA